METKTDLQSPVLSPRELAWYLGISETKARRLLRSGEIRSFKVGTLSKVRKADVDSWMVQRIAEDANA